ncbi:MAG: hypothetical protein JJ895_09165 [Balneolaceae bacterium]|nr:hypothetical protein [Balneolaceae bacterium]
MKNIYQILFLVHLIHSGCSLFDTEPKPLTPIDAYFYAEINGEPFNAYSLKAGVETWRGYSFLEFGGRYYHDEILSYYEQIVFSIIYDDDNNRYQLSVDSSLTKEIGFRVPLGSYTELEGDVVITRFETPVDSDGFLTVELTELEDGRKTISGTFEMTVYLTERINTSFPQQEEDTLHITNGRYLMELNDKRDD